MSECLGRTFPFQWQSWQWYSSRQLTNYAAFKIYGGRWWSIKYIKEICNLFPPQQRRWASSYAEQKNIKNIINMMLFCNSAQRGNKKEIRSQEKYLPSWKPQRLCMHVCICGSKQNSKAPSMNKYDAHISAEYKTKNKNETKHPLHGTKDLVYNLFWYKMSSLQI